MRVKVCAWVSVVAVLLGVCAFSPITASAKSAVNDAKVAPNEQWPECPSPTFEMCHIDITLHQASGKTPTVCSSFDNADGFCIGSSHGTPGWDSVYVPQQSIQADFTWKTSSGPVRDVDYTATETFSTVEGQIKGQVPSSKFVRLEGDGRNDPPCTERSLADTDSENLWRAAGALVY